MAEPGRCELLVSGRVGGVVAFSFSVKFISPNRVESMSAGCYCVSSAAGYLSLGSYPFFE